MIPIPYEQVDEFLSWLSERHPTAESEAGEEGTIRYVLGEYLRTKGKVGVLSPSYALRIFQICPMMYEPSVREQMTHFVGCGGCLHYIHERYNQIPRWPPIHPLLEGFLEYCKQSQWGEIFESDARDIESPWIGEGPEYIDHLFREYIHRVGPDLSRAFEEYIATADEELVHDYEKNRTEWGELSKRPGKVSREWTEPLALSEGLEQAAERLVGSVYLLLEGRFYKGAREDPQVYRRLAAMGLLSKNAARGIEFFIWLQKKYPELDLFGNAPTEGIVELVLDFCEERGYTDARSFSQEVMKWIRGDAEQLVLRRLRRTGRIKHDIRIGEPSFPVARTAVTPYHAMFLYHSSGDFPIFIKKYWKDLNYLTANKLNLYYSLEDLERKEAEAETLAQVQSLSQQSPGLPALMIWRGTITDSRFLPLESHTHEEIFELMKVLVRKIMEDAELWDIAEEVQKSTEAKVSTATNITQVNLEEGDLTMKPESGSSGSEASRIGGDGGSAVRAQVPLGRFTDVFAILNATGLFDVADALKGAREAILMSQELSDEQKQECAEILTQIGEEAAKAKPNHILVRSLCEGLKSTLKAVPEAVRLISTVEDILQKKLTPAVDTTKEIRAMIEKLEASEKKRFRNVLLLIGIPAIVILAFAFWMFWQAQKMKTKTEELQTAQQVVVEQQQALDSVRTQLEQASASSELIRLGKIQYQAKNYVAAIEAYDRAIELDPTNPVAYDLKGYSLLRSGESQKAVETLERAVELDSSYIWSHYDLALAYWAVGDTASAVGEVQDVLELDPSFRETIKNDGQFSAFKASTAFQAVMKMEKM